MESLVDSNRSAVILVLTALTVFVYWLYNNLTYWARKGVPSTKLTSALLPFINSIFSPVTDYAMYYYKTLPNEKFYGTYMLWRRCLVVKDPELINKVLIKDFAHFYNRTNIVEADTNDISKHLLNYDGEKWKALRNKLTPTFSSAKLKGMHSQLINCAQSFEKYISTHDRNDQIEMKDLCSRFSMDVVSSCAFGLDLDIMHNPDSKFFEVGKQTFAPNLIAKACFIHQPFLAPIFKAFKMGMLPKNLTNFFTNAVDETINYREHNNINRYDFLHLLTELEKKDEELVKNKQLAANDIMVFDRHSVISNAFVFFAAGYETAGTTLSFLLYEMSLNPEIQEDVHRELVTVSNKHNGEFPFEAFNELPLLEQVLSETLRIHSPAVLLDRKVSKDYKFPDCDVIIPKDTQIIIPVTGLHHDPRYFPEPEKFKPERFDPDNNTVQVGTYLPFGGGPRMCIAMRFATLEVKVAAAILLKSFRVHTCSKTEVPIQPDARSFMYVPKNGIWLSFEKRNILNNVD